MSTRQLTDASQDITDTYTYDAFGLLLNRSGATENNFLYTGEQYDPNVGFYYLRARYYNPSIGRFLSQDTYPGMQFEPGSLHKYLYCDGDPINRYDPTGKRRTFLETVAVVGISMILISRVYTNAFHLLSWIAGKKEPVEWTGNMIYATYSPKIIGPGWGVIIAGLTGRLKDGPSLNASYFILMAGISFAPLSLFKYPFLKVNWAIPIGGIKLETPGLIGLKKIALWGPTSWYAVSAIPAFGITIDYNFYMGMGKAYFPRPDWLVGIDIGAEAMGGWSFLIY